jgi:hypothetical protein
MAGFPDQRCGVHPARIPLEVYQSARRQVAALGGRMEIVAQLLGAGYDIGPVVGIGEELVEEALQS